MDRDVKLDIDGFKIDEAYHFSPYSHMDFKEWRITSEYDYHMAVYDKCKSYGLTCLMNTGTWYNSEVLMELCDIMGTEGAVEAFVSNNFNSGKPHENFDWRHNYNKYKFEGRIDNKDIVELQVDSGLELAISKIQTMFDAGIGNINCGIVKGGTITEWVVPDWYESYMTYFGMDKLEVGDNRFLLPLIVLSAGLLIVLFGLRES